MLSFVLPLLLVKKIERMGEHSINISEILPSIRWNVCLSIIETISFVVHWVIPKYAIWYSTVWDVFFCILCTFLMRKGNRDFLSCRFRDKREIKDDDPHQIKFLLSPSLGNVHIN